MKDFIWKIIFFAVCVFVPLVCAEVYVENLPNPSRDKHQWMLQNSHEVKTLILGSSHTFYGIRPDLLPLPAFSLAQIAQTYRYDWYLLSHYTMDSLQTVILPFSYFSLYEDFENMPRERYNAIRYRLYMDCDLHSPLSYYGFEWSSIDALMEKLKSLWQPQTLSWDSLGWGTDYSLVKRSPNWDNGMEAAKNNTYADTSLIALNVALLDSMMTYCDRRNVRLLLITTPLSSGFMENMSVQQVERNKRYLNLLLGRHPNVEYTDYSKDSDFVDMDFYDSHHLSEYGAKKLTLKLADKLSP